MRVQHGVCRLSGSGGVRRCRVPEGMAVFQFSKRLMSRVEHNVRTILVFTVCVVLVGAFALLLLSQHLSTHATGSSEAQTSATPSITVSTFSAATATGQASPIAEAPTQVPTPTPPPTPTRAPTATRAPTSVPVTQEVFTCATATPEQSVNHQYYYLIHI